jgi:predicted dehydrogenase
MIDEVVFCDQDEDRVSEIASNYGVKYVTDHGELESTVDAAVVATPSTTHNDIATSLLSAGVDCLVEKPLATSSDDAWEIVETAEQANATLAVGHIFRHHPALQELKRRIDRGELGEIKYLHTNRFSFRVPRETSGVLNQLAVHDLDIYRYLLNKLPERLYCKTNSWIRENVEETASLTLDYGNTIGTINESWQVPVFGKQRELIVVGTERAAYLDYLEDTEFELYDARIQQSGGGFRAIDEGKITHETEDREPLRAEAVDFIDASRSDTDPLADGTIGAETVDMIELAQESNAANRAIPVDNS